jgi:hypothetical protein
MATYQQTISHDTNIISDALFISQVLHLVKVKKAASLTEFFLFFMPRKHEAYNSPSGVSILGKRKYISD